MHKNPSYLGNPYGLWDWVEDAYDASVGTWVRLYDEWDDVTDLASKGAEQYQANKLEEGMTNWSADIAHRLKLNEQEWNTLIIRNTPQSVDSLIGLIATTTYLQMEEAGKATSPGIVEAIREPLDKITPTLLGHSDAEFARRIEVFGKHVPLSSKAQFNRAIQNFVDALPPATKQEYEKNKTPWYVTYKWQLLAGTLFVGTLYFTYNNYRGQ